MTELPESFRVPSPIDDDLALAIVRRRPAPGALERGTVLYVHGATFPSALAVGFKFDGMSWMDDLTNAGFDVWAFDFHGYGGSSRYREMDQTPMANGPLGRARVAAAQVDAIVGFVLAQTGRARLNLIAHSWGTQPAALFASQQADCVDRLVLFAPILQRKLPNLPSPETLPAYRFWTIEEQWSRFVEDVPNGHPPVLLRRHFERWVPAYLATDPASMTRTPPAVITPAGPQADILATWSGALPYEPAAIRAETLVVRGAWDSLCTDADVRWLRSAFCHGVPIHDVAIPKATHLMHLEEGRFDLYRAARQFLTERQPT